MGVNSRKRQSIILAGVYRVIPDLDRLGCIPAGAPRSRSRMFLTYPRWIRCVSPPGCAGISPADSSVTHHGREGILGARASSPRSPHEGGTPAWECRRLARRQPCDASRDMVRVLAPPGCAGVSPADSSVTNHGTWCAFSHRLGARASRPQTAV